MVCSVCGQETFDTFTLDGRELCHDCLMDVAEEVKQALEIIPVHYVAEVLERIGIAKPISAAA